jgi:hypothetical protein
MFARNFLRSGVLPLQAARAFSEAVADEIRDGSEVAVSFDGFRGASSSFFNAFWLGLIAIAGVDALARVHPETTSHVLADVMERSRIAAVARAKTAVEPQRGGSSSSSRTDRSSVAPR